MLFMLAGLLGGIYAVAVGAGRSRTIGGIAIGVAVAGLFIPFVGIASAFIAFAAVGSARVDRAYRISGE